MRLVLIAVLGAACSKADTGSTGGAAAPPGGPREAVLAAWKAGGLAPSPFTAATIAVGKDCASGTVNNVDVILCVFPTPAAAKQAEDVGLVWVGDTTGMSQARGSVVIAAADRRKADPSGRTINQLMKLAPK